ncbi:transposase [Fusobacterium pseudoperiodonticum]|nr:transposase [Fusobacterium pseudoperiodonticum]
MIQLNQLKVIKKEYFWSRNFLVLSISGVSIEVIKKYIQGQGGENEDN